METLLLLLLYSGVKGNKIPQSCSGFKNGPSPCCVEQLQLEPPQLTPGSEKVYCFNSQDLFRAWGPISRATSCGEIPFPLLVTKHPLCDSTSKGCDHVWGLEYYLTCEMRVCLPAQLLLSPQPTHKGATLLLMPHQFAGPTHTPSPLIHEEDSEILELPSLEAANPHFLAENQGLRPGGADSNPTPVPVWGHSLMRPTKAHHLYKTLPTVS